MQEKHICKNCCYFIIENNDKNGYCCVEPLYTFVNGNHTACKLYTSDMDDDCDYNDDDENEDIIDINEEDIEDLI